MEVLEVKLVEVPQVLPEKVYSTERVGISKATHDEHLKLFQGYANKTNEIRKALEEIQNKERDTHKLPALAP